MAGDQVAPGDRGGEIEQGPAKVPIHPIGERRGQPLDQHRVAAQEQAQRLADVPAIDVEIAGEAGFDDVARRIEGEIGLAPADIEEAAVVVAVG